MTTRRIAAVVFERTVAMVSMAIVMSILLAIVLAGAGGLAAQPGATATAEALIRAGNEDYNVGRYEQAIASYTRALEKKKSKAVYLNLGHARLRLERWDRALEAYAFAEPVEAMRWIATCHEKRGRFAEAERALAVHLLWKPADDEARLLRATLCARDGRHAIAAKLYRAVLARRPTDPTLYRALARQLIATGRKAEAIDFLEIVWRLGDRSIDSARLLADLYMNADMPLEAARYYGRYLDVAKKPTAEDYFRTGYTYFLVGDFVTARRYFEEATKRDASHARSYVYLGDVARGRGNEAEAERLYRKALAADERFAVGHASLGALHLARQSFDAAAAAFERALAHGDRTVATPYNLVLALTRGGKRARAIRALKRALHAHPRNPRLTDLVAIIAEGSATPSK